MRSKSSSQTATRGLGLLCEFHAPPTRPTPDTEHSPSIPSAVHTSSACPALQQYRNRCTTEDMARLTSKDFLTRVGSTLDEVGMTKLCVEAAEAMDELEKECQSATANTLNSLGALREIESMVGGGTSGPMSKVVPLAVAKLVESHQSLLKILGLAKSQDGGCISQAMKRARRGEATAGDANLLQGVVSSLRAEIIELKEERGEGKS